jgi:hypothetical protein
MWWIHIQQVSKKINLNKSDTRVDSYWVTIAHHRIHFAPAQMLTRPPAAIHGEAGRDNLAAAPGRERSEGRGWGERGTDGDSVVPSSTRSPAAAGLPLTTPVWGGGRHGEIGSGRRWRRRRPRGGAGGSGVQHRGGGVQVALGRRVCVRHWGGDGLSRGV